MPARQDPIILAFRDEILNKIIKNKIIDLAYENKGSFLDTADFCDQFRNKYKCDTGDRTIQSWMKELNIVLQRSVTFIDMDQDHMRQPPPPMREPNDEDFEMVFDNE